jgi:hypothetical protein
MPLNLDPGEARRFLELHQAPAPHLDLVHAMSFRAAAAGLKLGVFEALGDGALPAADLAAKLPADERGLTVLLDALVRFGYLERAGDRYANGPVASTWLLPDRPGSYAGVLSFWDTVLTELWGDLDSSVRGGHPAHDFYAWLERRPEVLREFQGMLGGMAGWVADEIVAAVPLPPDATRLLDVGGGHGRYSMAFCGRYPGLHATVLDLPGALAAGRDAVAAAGMTDQITCEPGDLLTDDLGRGYDVALLFNVVHSLEPGQARALLGRAAAAVRPGATVLLLEPLRDGRDGAGRADEAFVSGFSLNLFHTQGGQVYGLEQITSWLTAAGLEPPRRHPLERSPTDWLLTTTKPA